MFSSVCQSHDIKQSEEMYILIISDYARYIGVYNILSLPKLWQSVKGGTKNLACRLAFGIDGIFHIHCKYYKIAEPAQNNNY